MRSHFHARNFGVLEIIVSVAILVAFSVFVLRLFVAVSSDEKKMKELDRANYTAVSYIEQFKAGASPFDLRSTLGGSASGGSYTRTVTVPGGIRARIEIKEDTRYAAGSLYVIRVDMEQSSDGSELLTLSGFKYFSDETGETVG